MSSTQYVYDDEFRNLQSKEILSFANIVKFTFLNTCIFYYAKSIQSVAQVLVILLQLKLHIVLLVFDFCYFKQAKHILYKIRRHYL